MTIDVDIQNTLDANDSAIMQLPATNDVFSAVRLVCDAFNDGRGEVTVRFVDMAESQALNAAYRDKDKPTNVLSFPADLPEFIPSDLLGDLVICPEVVLSEAAEQHKLPLYHYQHLIIHGTLHLLGFDHIEEAEAVVMEAHEVTLLQKLNIDDPYQDH